MNAFQDDGSQQAVACPVCTWYNTLPIAKPGLVAGSREITCAVCGAIYWVDDAGQILSTTREGGMPDDGGETDSAPDENSG